MSVCRCVSSSCSHAFKTPLGYMTAMENPLTMPKATPIPRWSNLQCCSLSQLSSSICEELARFASAPDIDANLCVSLQGLPITGKEIANHIASQVPESAHPAVTTTQVCDVQTTHGCHTNGPPQFNKLVHTLFVDYFGWAIAP